MRGASAIFLPRTGGESNQGRQDPCAFILLRPMANTPPRDSLPEASPASAVCASCHRSLFETSRFVLDGQVRYLSGAIRCRPMLRRSALTGLAVLTVLAWAATVWQTAAGDRLTMAGVPMSLGMAGRLGFTSAALFLLIWIVMMAAMMFPSNWPVVLVYAAVVRTRRQGSVPLFVAGYLAVWEAFGALAYAGYVGVGAVLASTAGLSGRLAALTGALVIV